MSELSDIERTVMQRIRVIRALRLAVSNGMLATLLLLAALWGISREVWVARVFENGPRGLVGHTEYLAYAFEHTRIVVQALTLTVLASAFYLARLVARGVTVGVGGTFAA